MKPRLNKPVKAIWHHANGTLLSHCTPTQHHNADIVDVAHKARWPGFTSRVYRNSDGELYHVGYHLVIDLINETITKTRAFAEEGAHAIGMNRSSIGILILGNYDACSGETIPEDKEWLLLKAWQMCKESYPNLVLTDNVPHRTYATKSCYGNSLTDKYIQETLMRNMTVESAIVNDKEEQEVANLQKIFVDLLQTYIALLIQVMSRKRLSLKEK